MRYSRIKSRTLIIFLASSNRMKITDSASPTPATNKAKKNPTRRTTGRKILKDWPEI